MFHQIAVAFHFLSEKFLTISVYMSTYMRFLYQTFCSECLAIADDFLLSWKKVSVIIVLLSFSWSIMIPTAQAAEFQANKAYLEYVECVLKNRMRQDGDISNLKNLYENSENPRPQLPICVEKPEFSVSGGIDEYYNKSAVEMSNAAYPFYERIYGYPSEYLITVLDEGYNDPDLDVQFEAYQRENQELNDAYQFDFEGVGKPTVNNSLRYIWKYYSSSEDGGIKTSYVYQENKEKELRDLLSRWLDEQDFYRDLLNFVSLFTGKNLVSGTTNSVTETCSNVEALQYIAVISIYYSNQDRFSLCNDGKTYTMNEVKSKRKETGMMLGAIDLFLRDADQRYFDNIFASSDLMSPIGELMATGQNSSILTKATAVSHSASRVVLDALFLLEFMMSPNLGDLSDMRGDYGGYTSNGMYGREYYFVLPNQYLNNKSGLVNLLHTDPYTQFSHSDTDSDFPEYVSQMVPGQPMTVKEVDINIPLSSTPEIGEYGEVIAHEQANSGKESPPDDGSVVFSSQSWIGLNSPKTNQGGFNLLREASRYWDYIATNNATDMLTEQVHAAYPSEPHIQSSLRLPREYFLDSSGSRPIAHNYDQELTLDERRVMASGNGKIQSSFTAALWPYFTFQTIDGNYEFNMPAFINYLHGSEVVKPATDLEDENVAFVYTYYNTHTNADFNYLMPVYTDLQGNRVKTPFPGLTEQYDSAHVRVYYKRTVKFDEYGAMISIQDQEVTQNDWFKSIPDKVSINDVLQKYKLSSRDNITQYHIDDYLGFRGRDVLPQDPDRMRQIFQNAKTADSVYSMSNSFERSMNAFKEFSRMYYGLNQGWFSSSENTTYARYIDEFNDNQLLCFEEALNVLDCKGRTLNSLNDTLGYYTVLQTFDSLYDALDSTFDNVVSDFVSFLSASVSGHDPTDQIDFSQFETSGWVTWLYSPLTLLQTVFCSIEDEGILGICVNRPLKQKKEALDTMADVLVTTLNSKNNQTAIILDKINTLKNLDTDDPGTLLEIEVLALSLVSDMKYIENSIGGFFNQILQTAEWIDRQNSTFMIVHLIIDIATLGATAPALLAKIASNKWIAALIKSLKKASTFVRRSIRMPLKRLGLSENSINALALLPSQIGRRINSIFFLLRNTPAAMVANFYTARYRGNAMLKLAEKMHKNEMIYQKLIGVKKVQKSVGKSTRFDFLARAQMFYSGMNRKVYAAAFKQVKSGEHLRNVANLNKTLKGSPNLSSAITEELDKLEELVTNITETRIVSGTAHAQESFLIDFQKSLDSHKALLRITDPSEYMKRYRANLTGVLEKDMESFIYSQDLLESALENFQKSGDLVKNSNLMSKYPNLFNKNILPQERALMLKKLLNEPEILSEFAKSTVEGSSALIGEVNALVRANEELLTFANNSHLYKLSDMYVKENKMLVRSIADEGGVEYEGVVFKEISDLDEKTLRAIRNELAKNPANLSKTNKIDDFLYNLKQRHVLDDYLKISKEKKSMREVLRSSVSRQRVLLMYKTYFDIHRFIDTLNPLVYECNAFIEGDEDQQVDLADTTFSQSGGNKIDNSDELDKLPSELSQEVFVSLQKIYGNVANIPKWAHEISSMFNDRKYVEQRQEAVINIFMDIEMLRAYADGSLAAVETKSFFEDNDIVPRLFAVAHAQNNDITEEKFLSYSPNVRRTILTNMARNLYSLEKALNVESYILGCFNGNTSGFTSEIRQINNINITGVSYSRYRNPIDLFNTIGRVLIIFAPTAGILMFVINRTRRAGHAGNPEALKKDDSQALLIILGTVGVPLLYLITSIIRGLGSNIFEGIFNSLF